jgi:hypothetical protein
MFKRRADKDAVKLLGPDNLNKVLGGPRVFTNSIGGHVQYKHTVLNGPSCVFSVIMLSLHLPQGLSTGRFPTSFPVNILYAYTE